MAASFENLVAEAAAAPIDGWDFSWLDGRATEDRPPWRYSEQVASRARTAMRLLDLDTGGGEMIARVPVLPVGSVVTEAFAPNLPVAARRLRPRGVGVVGGQATRLPVRDSQFDLVTSRHPIDTDWCEVARVLAPGGTYLSQQVGPHTVGELADWMLGPQPAGSKRDPRQACQRAASAGLVVRDLQEARLETAFFDIGAVVYFLRLVVWIVPGFDAVAFEPRLRALHHRIERDGPFVCHATRFLIEATKPQ